MGSYKKTLGSIPVKSSNIAASNASELLGNNKIDATANSKKLLGNLSKWIPLICAGAAVGVSILALKEIKNVRRELIDLKNEQIVNVPNLETQQFDPELLKRIELMDEQIVKISKYLGSQQNKEKKPKINKIINEEPELIKVEKPKINKIINEEPQKIIPKVEKPKEVIIDLTKNILIAPNSPKVAVSPQEPVKESITEIDEEEYEYEEVTDDDEE